MLHLRPIAHAGSLFKGICFFLLIGAANAVCGQNTIRSLLDRGNEYIIRPGEKPSDLDSALTLLKEAETLSRTQQLRQLELEAKFYQGIAHLEAFDFGKAKQIAAPLKDSLRTRFLLRLATEERKGHHPGDKDSVIVHLKQVMDEVSSLDDPYLQEDCRAEILGYYMEAGDKGTMATLLLQWRQAARERHRFQEELYYTGLLTWNFPEDDGYYEMLVDCRGRLLKGQEWQLPAKRARAIIDSIASLFNQKAVEFGDKNDQPMVLKQYRRALGYTTGSPQTIISANIGSSYAYILQGRFVPALIAALEAIRCLEKNGPEAWDRRMISIPYNTVGRIYYELGYWELSLQYYNRSFDLGRKEGIPFYGFMFKEVTKAYLQLGRAQEALSFILSNLTHIVKTPRDEAPTYEAIGDCYLALKQPDQAEKYYTKGRDVSKDLFPHFKLIFSYAFARLYMQTGAFDKARACAAPLVADSNIRMVPVTVQQDAHYMLARLDSAAGDYPGAFKHLQKHTYLHDSLFNSTKTQQIEEIKTRFESEKKDQDLRLKDQELRQIRSTRNASITGGALLALVLVLLNNRYRLKQKSNRLLQSQQTEISRSNEELTQLNTQQRRLLAEKEWLIKEIHHRVKNNLQIVMSLLNMQSHYLSDEYAINAFGEISHRMQAISLIHQRLYQVDNLTVINMPVYVRELVSYLKTSSVGAQPIKFILSIDPIDLDVAESVPLGLILNEALTNAIKYAFPGRDTDSTGGTGTGREPDSTNDSIWVTMLKSDDTITLTVADNGRGLPENFDISHTDSLGFQLMETLVEQLEGALSVENEGGLSITIRFPYLATTILPETQRLLS